VVNSHLGIVERGTGAGRALAGHRSGRTVLSSNSMNVCLDLIRSGDAILVYPVIARPFFEANGAAMLHIDGPRDVSSIGIYSLKERTQNASTRDIRTRIRAAVASMPDPA